MRTYKAQAFNNQEEDNAIEVTRNVGDNETDEEIRGHLKTRAASALGCEVGDVSLEDVRLVDEDSNQVQIEKPSEGNSKQNGQEQERQG